MNQLTISVVTYNDFRFLEKLFESIKKIKINKKVYIIDNSDKHSCRKIAEQFGFSYYHTGKNLGFSKAHNIALKEAVKNGSKAHLILNPDVWFDQNVVETLLDFLLSDNSIGIVTPKILNADGTLQYHCRLLPSPIDLISRRFLNEKKLTKYLGYNKEKYELRITGYNKIMEVPFIMACFLLIKTKTIKKVGLLDERFFIYMEDVDFCRRTFRHYKVMFFPHVEAYHFHNRASYKNKRTLFYHTISAIKYFNKWGWIHDHERDYINEYVLNNYAH
jgi:GT2 family glycosyltransferase